MSRQQDGVLTSINQIEDWFLARKAPYWTLYRGRKVESSQRIAKNDTEQDVENSWNDLKAELERFGQFGGSFFLFSNDRTGGGNGYSQIIQLGNPAQVAGINGIHQNPMAGIYGNASIGEIIEKEAQKAVELDRMRREIEDLKNAREAEPSTLEKTTDFIAGLPEPMQMAIAGFIQAMTMKFVGGAGMPIQSAPVGEHREDSVSGSAQSNQNGLAQSAFLDFAGRHPNYGEILAALNNYDKANPGEIEAMTAAMAAQQKSA